MLHETEFPVTIAWLVDWVIGVHEGVADGVPPGVVAVGVALAEPDEPSDGGQLIARADLAMYAAKGEGQARVVLAASTEADREVG